MSMFRMRRRAEVRGGPTVIPGLPEVAAQLGLQPASAERPFDGHLEDKVHEATRNLHGQPRSRTAFTQEVVGATTFSDVYRGNVDGRTVTIANAWTDMEMDRPVEVHYRGTAVCAVELATMLPIAGIEPRSKPAVMLGQDTPTDNPAFDARYRVVGVLAGAAECVTSAVQRAVMARDDWVFLAERYMFGCVAVPEFRSADEVRQRVRDVLAVVAAFPVSIVPATVDRSFDDLIARIGQLHSVDDTLAFLQNLTPQERERVAKSDTPLAAFADVRTPEEAMARLGTLDQQQKLQIFAMFAKAKDQRTTS